MVGCQPLGHSSHHPNREAWRNRTQNTDCSAYLLIFFCGLLKWVAEFTSVTSSADHQPLWGRHNVLDSPGKQHNWCLTEGLLSKCCLTLAHSGRASHSPCRTERLFIHVRWPSVWEKVGLLETSGTRSLKTDTAVCLIRYHTEQDSMFSWMRIHCLKAHQWAPCGEAGLSRATTGTREITWINGYLNRGCLSKKGSGHNSWPE